MSVRCHRCNKKLCRLEAADHGIDHLLAVLYRKLVYVVVNLALVYSSRNTHAKPCIVWLWWGLHARAMFLYRSAVQCCPAATAYFSFPATVDISGQVRFKRCPSSYTIPRPVAHNAVFWLQFWWPFFSYPRLLVTFFSHICSYLHPCSSPPLTQLWSSPLEKYTWRSAALENFRRVRAALRCAAPYFDHWSRLTLISEHVTLCSYNGHSWQ